jgi:hypothetical protein
MTTLGHELKVVQNEALASVLLWRFAVAYAKTRPNNDFAPVLLSSLLLPMVWHEETLENISSTFAGSGLRAFAEKFSETKPARLDVLLGLHNRASLWREKWISSVRLGLSSGLIRFSPESRIIPIEKPWSTASHPQPIRVQINASEKVGVWFAKLSLQEIAMSLHVRF